MALPKLTKEETIARIKVALEDGWSIHVAKKLAFVRPTYEREVLNKDPEYVSLVLPYRKVIPKNPRRQGMDVSLVSSKPTPTAVEYALPRGSHAQD